MRNLEMTHPVSLQCGLTYSCWKKTKDIVCAKHILHFSVGYLELARRRCVHYRNIVIHLPQCIVFDDLFKSHKLNTLNVQCVKPLILLTVLFNVMFLNKIPVRNYMKHFLYVAVMK